jgi:YVTN family beta-propeller protein
MLNKKLTRRNALKLGLLSGGLALFSGQTNAPTIGTRAASAQTAALQGSPAVSNTAYVANEQTCTVSVIDTTTHTIKTTIGLGSDPAIPGTPQPNGPFNGETQHHNAFYNGHVDPHGLWLTPDASVLLVACRISGTVVAIDTTTNSVLGYAPVGREPHLATVHPNGTEAWVAIRGESYLDVLKLDRDDLFDANRRETDRMEKVATIDTMEGPSMVSFTSNGSLAFVAAGKETRVDKIDTTTRQIVASNEKLPAPFTPFGLVSPENELYLVHKGAGTLSILRTLDLGFVVEGMPIGARPNHIFFVGNLAYVTVGGPPPSATDPDPAGKIVVIDRSTHKVVNELTGSALTGEPHAIWATAGGKLYVGHERGNKVSVIDTGDANNHSDDSVEGTVKGSARDLGFLKKPIDIVISP